MQYVPKKVNEKLPAFYSDIQSTSRVNDQDMESMNDGTSDDSEDSDFVDSEYDMEDGDDDLFADIVDEEVVHEGCHMKTKTGGILLTAVGIDPNDCIYPIAVAVVEVECKESWKWFLNTLKDDLGIQNTYPWTIMTDKQKVSMSIFVLIYPCLIYSCTDLYHVYRV